MFYEIAKIFHLAGLVIWLGPSTGGYILVLLARQEGNLPATLWVLEEYGKLMNIEALGLFVLIASGTAMRLSDTMLSRARWLKVKLITVFCVFVPLEIGQLLIYHLQLKPAFRTGKGLNLALDVFDTFSIAALIILVPTIAWVFYLAVLRPAFGKREKGV